MNSAHRDRLAWMFFKSRFTIHEVTNFSPEEILYYTAILDISSEVLREFIDETKAVLLKKREKNNLRERLDRRQNQVLITDDTSLRMPNGKYFSDSHVSLPKLPSIVLESQKQIWIFVRDKEIKQKLVIALGLKHKRLHILDRLPPRAQFDILLEISQIEDRIMISEVKAL